MTTIPFNISDRSLAFFAKGRPWTVASDNANFEKIKQLLTSPPFGDDLTLADELVELADLRVGLKKVGEGKLEVSPDGKFVWNGTPLHNLWTEKYTLFKAQGLPTERIFKAIESLMKNPTPAAIERLPIFLEHVRAGFMEDGRCTGYKAVRKDYLDHYTETFDNSVGKHVSMDRKHVDPDPNATCSRGLHIGSLKYVTDHYQGEPSKLMLVAFWPHDVVAVPTDYNGSKMRVCAYEVLYEVDRQFVDEWVREMQHVVASPVPVQPVAQPTLLDRLKVGDWVLHEGDDMPSKVVAISYVDKQVVTEIFGSTDTFDIDDLDDITTEPPVWRQAYDGCKIRVKDSSFLRDGIYIVSDTDSWAKEPDEYSVIVMIDDVVEVRVQNKNIVEVFHQDSDIKT